MPKSTETATQTLNPKPKPNSTPPSLSRRNQPQEAFLRLRCLKHAESRARLSGECCNLFERDLRKVRDAHFATVLQPAGSCFASGFWGITTCKVLYCPKLLGDYNLHGRFRFVVFLKHAKSVLDCGSSHILSTPLRGAIPVHHIRIYLEHPRHVTSPAHHTY